MKAKTVNPSLSHPVILWDRSAAVSSSHQLILEEPLSIRIQGNPYSVVMRTPGEELAHVAGFCLGEGIVDTPDDIKSLAFCDGEDSNVVTVTLNDSRRLAIEQIMDRRGFISQTSCGLCGKELVDDLFLQIQPLVDEKRVDLNSALACLGDLSAHQPLRDRTRASHAAVIFSRELQLLSSAEDVGRHNALDKAVGKLFLNRRLDRAGLLVLSSRISYELVQKAARARIPIIFALSRPTSLAVDLATRLNITLVSHTRDAGTIIFCGDNRLIR